MRRASISVGPAKLDATARYDSSADTLASTIELSAAEAGSLADLAGGATWRSARASVKADLSGLAGKPQGSVALTASAEEVAVMTTGCFDAPVPSWPVVTAGDICYERGMTERAMPREMAGNPPLRVVHLEDNSNDAELVRSLLECEGFELQVSRAETRDLLATYFNACRKTRPFTALPRSALPASTNNKATTTRRSRSRTP